MADTTQIVVPFKTVVTALIKEQGIHTGIWGLFVRFGLNAANVGPTPQEMVPAAIIPIVEIGLQEFKEEGNIAVDAAKVNPATPHKEGS